MRCDVQVHFFFNFTLKFTFLPGFLPLLYAKLVAFLQLFDEIYFYSLYLEYFTKYPTGTGRKVSLNLNFAISLMANSLNFKFWVLFIFFKYLNDSLNNWNSKIKLRQYIYFRLFDHSEPDRLIMFHEYFHPVGQILLYIYSICCSDFANSTYFGVTIIIYR